ncbi:UDP-N-acetyl-D-mannosamine dehydrogenase [Sphingopyxis flava]|uniref:UDP-N-acetyl-D-mannosaminuronic acid dehydrogenase n=1 Tax=Sphingopyxis flava TaxID=1507287 RepID=A0A1T5F5Z8_9SPHN|nr:UDP-N-acetyl-D-mannosamine dehydrogenase [Sphingopyxis flava]SKB91586.1 UDP-N-acetyl-D-mannosaminuronic acid dehydrogenase [Sphingopyxis flava]
MQKFDTISVIGLGYIGLPTAAMFASKGCRVIGIDINPATVDTINSGAIHIVEPDLDEVVHAAVARGCLSAALTPQPADAFLIAVPTPFKEQNHEPDIAYIEAAARAIAPVLRSGNLVVLESTSPVGATEQMASWLAEERPDLTFPQHAGAASDIRIAHCPERVLPGKVMQELVTNDRVIGGLTPACSAEACNLYRIFVEGECVVTDARTAELAKLTENSFRDVNIAFANELSIVCDGLGIDVWELISLANRHPRVNILQPGPGVGGHCIAVDPWFIVSSSPEHTHLIRAAREVNDKKPLWVLDKIRQAVTCHLDNNSGISTDEVTIACYGLAFKADIDDLRESPALSIVQRLAATHSGSVLVVEPNIERVPNSLRGVELVDEASARARGDVHVLLVDHREFRGMASPRGYIVDTRGVWS